MDAGREEAAEPLTADDFRPHVGKVFRVRAGRHALILADVQIARFAVMGVSPPPRDPFTLIFRGPPGDVLREGLYTLHVDDGPLFGIYVMPIHTTARDRQDYQAVFN